MSANTAILPWGLSRGKDEEKHWDDEEELRSVKHKNDILCHKMYGWLMVIMTGVFSFLFLCALGVLAWHYCTPIEFLSENKLSKLQSIVFSGSIGAVVSGIVQKQLDKVK